MSSGKHFHNVLCLSEAKGMDISMKKSKIGIVGLGHVGSIMKELFVEAVVYDEIKKIGSRDEINKCKIVFICVPTPKAKDGHCDTAVVEYVLNWLDSEVIVLRSTVPVGFTDKYRKRTGKRIVFQPEYYGETYAHPFANPRNRTWITLGGIDEDTEEVAELYERVFTSEIVINQVDAKTAELAKYMENAFLATKVTFCNQFYDIAKAFDVNYNKLRETWLLDPRIGRSHTFVYGDERGYGGSCLPKDLSGIIYQAQELGMDVDLLKAVQETNRKYHE